MKNIWKSIHIIKHKMLNPKYVFLRIFVLFKMFYYKKGRKTNYVKQKYEYGLPIKNVMLF